MAYDGMIIPIQIGGVGLQTDIEQVQQNPASLVMATNITMRFGAIEKDYGSQKWNSVALPDGVVGLSEWAPLADVQRTIAACRDGNVYRFVNAYERSVMAPSGGAPSSLTLTDQTVFVPGGAESLNRNRKLFIITGNDPIQVIDSDAEVIRPLQNPAADWTGSPPKGGIIFNQGFWVWGNPNNPHMMYRSNISDQEDFTTLNAFQLVSVFPGDGDGIECCFNWKGRLFIVKKPFGLYYIDDSNINAPVPVKLSSSFGAASPKCAIQMLDDMLVGNSTGSITSLNATLNLGGVEEGDALKVLKCIRQVQTNSNSAAIGVRQAVYYENKKQCLFVYRSSSGRYNDRILVIDNHESSPRVSWIDKDQPTCLALIRDIKNVPTPFYGAEDGFIYKMDCKDRNVGGNAYTGTFQTPYVDLGFVNPTFADKDKNFDFIGITFQPKGNWNLSCDVFVDDKFVQTVNFNMGRDKHLDGEFPLDFTRLSGVAPITRHQKINGFGKRLSARFYNSEAGQNFCVSQIQYYFRIAGTKNR